MPLRTLRFLNIDSAIPKAVRESVERRTDGQDFDVHLIDEKDESEVHVEASALEHWDSSENFGRVGVINVW